MGIIMIPVDGAHDHGFTQDGTGGANLLPGADLSRGDVMADGEAEGFRIEHDANPVQANAGETSLRIEHTMISQADERDAAMATNQTATPGAEAADGAALWESAPILGAAAEDGFQFIPSKPDGAAASSDETSVEPLQDGVGEMPPPDPSGVNIFDWYGDDLAPLDTDPRGEAMAIVSEDEMIFVNSLSTMGAGETCGI